MSIHTIIENFGLLVQTILLCIQIPTLIFLIIYVVKTWQMASSTRQAAEATEASVKEMREMRDVETSPHVIVYFDLPQDHLIIYLVVRNIGKGTANEVKLKFDPPLQATEKFMPIDTPMIRDGISYMPPGYELRTILSGTIEYFGNENLPFRYSATVTFFGGLRSEQRVTNQILDLSMHKNLMYVQRKDIHNLTTQTERLVKNQEKLIGAMDSIANIVNKGIFVNNPYFVVLNIDTMTEQWVDILIIKLKEFLGIWSESSKERETGSSLRHLQASLLLLSQQIFFILSNRSDTLSDELKNVIGKIADNIHELGVLRFYIDGGHSLNKFNELGDSIIQEINEL